MTCDGLLTVTTLEIPAGPAGPVAPAAPAGPAGPGASMSDRSPSLSFDGPIDALLTSSPDSDEFLMSAPVTDEFLICLPVIRVEAAVAPAVVARMTASTLRTSAGDR